MSNSHCDERKSSTTTVLTSQRVLWDMFLVLGIFTATCCLTLHLAGLNDFNTPISVEYEQGNRLAILFFCSSLSLIVAVGLLYRCFGQWIAALLSLLVLMCLVIVVGSKPHSIVHIYAFYSTLFGAILTPLFVLWRLRLTWRLWGLSTVLVAVVLLLYCTGTKDLDIEGFGIAQRSGVLLSLLFNAFVLNHCRFIS